MWPSQEIAEVLSWSAGLPSFWCHGRGQGARHFCRTPSQRTRSVVFWQCSSGCRTLRVGLNILPNLNESGVVLLPCFAEHYHRNNIMADNSKWQSPVAAPFKWTVECHGGEEGNFLIQLWYSYTRFCVKLNYWSIELQQICELSPRQWVFCDNSTWFLHVSPWGRGRYGSFRLLGETHIQFTRWRSS